MAGSFAPGRKSKTDDGDKNFWATRWETFWDAQKLYGRPFQFDVAAEEATSKCGPIDYFSPQRGDDALQLDWPMDWWCNPPFDQKIEFIQQALQQAAAGRPGMMLLPYEPLSGWWQSNLKYNVIVYEPDGRYNFVERDGVTVKTGVNFGSALVLFGGFHLGLSIRIPFERGVGVPSCLTCMDKRVIGGLVRWGDGEVDSVVDPCPDCSQPANDNLDDLI